MNETAPDTTAAKKFPEGFFWGASTSAHQVEGNTFNDWSEWEKANAPRLARTAAQRYGTLASWEHIRTQAGDPRNYISGAAADHYNRFEQDFELARSLDHNAHRFGIEWSRIEPQEGHFDEKAIEHYRAVVAALRAQNMEPFVCLWHWTLPVWLADKGGVATAEFGKYFARYVHVIAGALKSDVRYWLTLNEPTSVIFNSYVNGRWPPGVRNIRTALRVYRNLADAHRRGYQVLHNLDPQAQVGFGNIMGYIEPATASPLDRLAARFTDYWTNRHFLRLAGDDMQDFYALQYYFHLRLAFPRRLHNENKEVSDLGWELYQEGIYYLLKRLAARPGAAGKPIFITENGLADAQDTHRAKFIGDAVDAMRRALAEKVTVRGYFHWSLLDNFEWAEGYWPRFGLIEVDYATQKRTPRPSAFEFKKIIERDQN